MASRTGLRLVIVMCVAMVIATALMLAVGPAQSVQAQGGRGFSYGRFAAVNGRPGETVVPWPAGARHVLAMCVVDSYITDGENDMAWVCNWRWEHQQARFRLSTPYSQKGAVAATGILIDLDEFQQVSAVEFTLDSDGVWIKDLNDHWTRYATPATIRLPIPAGAVPVISVDRYETNKDDDFGFAIREAGSGYFDFYAFDGNFGSHVHGYIQVLQPRVPTGRANAFYDWRPNRQYYTQTYPGVIRAESYHTLAFSSIVQYVPYLDDDFQLESIVERSFDGRGGIVVANRFGTSRGNNDSWAGVQLIVLQR